MLRLAKVVAAHPEGHSVDVLMLDDLSRATGVQVLCDLGGSDFGATGLVAPDLAAPTDKWSPADSGTRDILAVVGMAGRVPVVLGFLFPQVAQVLFARDNFRVTRHASDVYETVNAAGDTELYHPSGTYFRIAQSPAHEDLTGQDFDGLWSIEKNTQTAVHVHLTVANAGSEVASFDIDPSGNVNVQAKGNMQATIGGTTSVTSSGAATVTAPSVTVDAQTTTLNGNLVVNGAVNVSQTVTAATDVIGGGISLKHHTHADPQGGDVGAPI